MLKSDPPIIVEQSYPADVEKIWQALTELEHLKQWFFDCIPEFKAEPGFETNFEISNEGRNFPHLWKVVEVVPNEKLVVNWQFGGYSGSTNVTFEIIPGDEENKVRLSTEVLEDHPQDIPEFKRESGVDGWKYFINERLQDHLA